jgi:hypothetical protein
MGEPKFAPLELQHLRLFKEHMHDPADRTTIGAV